MTHKFAASIIFPVDGPPIENGWIETSADGEIISVNQGEIPAGIAKSDGIIIPGFINTHCHLELSHLRGRVTEKQGMSAFIRSLFAQRFTFSNEDQLKAMQVAETEMINNGIVAVGDICNFNLSHEIKKHSKIYYHSFVEILGLDPKRAEEILLKGKASAELFSSVKNHQSNLTPHAPYSVSDWLFELLSAEYSNNFPVSIHMEESMDEYQFCFSKTGAFADLFTDFKIDYSGFNADPELTPLQRTIPKLKTSNKLLLVHNTYTSKEEMDWATNEHKNLYWCLCPNANLYITNRLPELDLFNNDKIKVTLGTDSLASNHQLNILDEMKTIRKAEPAISFEKLLKWATINGAEFLGIENTFGTISKGKKPGLVLLEGMNKESLQINENVKIKRLI